MYHNHANYQRRLDFIQTLLRERFNVQEAAQIVPIQYDPECPFQYNNFVYRITLPSAVVLTHKDELKQPDAVAIAPGTQEYIIRLTNPNAEGMYPKTRVENEVAMISLTASALRDFHSHVVPSVYAWGTAAAPSKQGWILQELMPGTPLNELFESMAFEEKNDVLGEMASLLKALQDFELPETVTQCGGVTFDEVGRIVSSEMPTVGSGPWPSYEAHFRARLQLALRKADANPYIKGWHSNGVRQRLDAFVESGVAAQFESLESKHDRAIVHADFTLHNLLYDATSKRITALLDYDFACILHPSYEFLYSFSGAGGQFQGWSDVESSDQTALRNAKLHGFPSPLPQDSEDGVQWDVAKAWEEHLERLDVKLPRTMKGIERVADVDAVLRSILPWRVTNSDVLRMQSERVILECRDENEGQLIKLLDHLGF